MKNKKIYIIALIAAIISGGLLFTFFSAYSKNGGNGKVALGQTEQVVVAIKDIKANTMITADMVSLKDVAASAVHPNSTKNLQDIVGQITDRDIVVDEQILTNKIAKVGAEGAKGKSLSYQVPDGMRAITIATDAVIGVGGYIEVGDLVDVLAYIKAEPKDEIDANGEKKKVDGSVTTPVVQAVEVAKLGDITTQDAASASTAVYANITLFLEPEDCSKLFEAQEASGGKLKVVLRQKADKEEIDNGLIRLGELFE